MFPPADFLEISKAHRTAWVAAVLALLLSPIGCTDPPIDIPPERLGVVGRWAAGESWLEISKSGRLDFGIRSGSFGRGAQNADITAIDSQRIEYVVGPFWTYSLALIGPYETDRAPAIRAMGVELYQVAR